jgi:hypothetical protein
LPHQDTVSDVLRMYFACKPKRSTTIIGLIPIITSLTILSIRINTLQTSA